MIDPRISLAAQVPNLESTFTQFQNTLNSVQNRKASQQQIDQNAELFPVQLQGAKNTNTLNGQVIDENRRKQYIESVASVKAPLDPLIEAGDIDGVMRFLDQHGRQLKAANLPTETTDEAYRLAASGDLNSIKQGYDIAYAEHQQLLGQTSAVKPQSSKILADGTSIQVLNNGETRVTSPSGNILEGQDRANAITAANQVEVELSSSKAGGRTKASEEEKTQAQIDREARVESERNANELKRIEIDETKIKNEQTRQEAINKKNIRRAEAEDAIDKASLLLKDDFFDKAFGKLFTNTTPLLRSQDSIDANAQLEQILSLLSLESRQKLKGQGTITEGEAETLAKSATILNDRLISTRVARKELRRIRDIFDDARIRNKLKIEPQQTEIASPNNVGGINISKDVANDPELQRLLKLEQDIIAKQNGGG